MPNPDSTRLIAPAAPSAITYLANAASGLAAAPVLDAVQAYLRREAEVGAPWALAEAEERLDAGYHAAARLLGAHVDEIAFVESGNRGLQALILSAGLQPGDHVLVDRTCWGGTIEMLASLIEVHVDVMPVDGDGRVDVAATRAAFHPRTRLILLTWAPATCGLVNPATAIGALAAETGTTFIVDACQMVGQRPVDVTALQCDGLIASGRKWLRGPRGTALLYASRAFLARSTAFMADQLGAPRSDARRYEQGEAFFAGRVGLGVAIESALAIGLAPIHTHIARQATRLRAGLSQLPRIKLVDQGDDLSGIVGFVGCDMQAAAIAAALATRQIAVSVLPAAYTPLDMAARSLPAVVRAAPHLFTQDACVDDMLAAMAEISG